jgi:hypothetical protein
LSVKSQLLNRRDRVTCKVKIATIRLYFERLKIQANAI